MKRSHRATAAVVVMLLLVAGGVIVIRSAYGYFNGDYRIAGDFPRAGQDLVPGSDVKYRGVNVGKVQHIKLATDGVQIVLRIHPWFKVPSDAVGTVRPKTIFGEKYVDLSFPSGEHGPYLGHGQLLAKGGTATEVEDLIAGATPLLSSINANDLATIVKELSDGTRGEGATVAKGFDDTLKLATLFADTIDAQTKALDSWSRFQDAIRTSGSDLNAIAANNNVALPELNKAEADFARALVAVRPLADQLAALLGTYRPDIDALLDRGDNVLRVLVAHQDDIRDSIHGFYRYVYKFAAAQSPDRLPDGSRFAYFKNFLLFSDVENLLCGVLAPPQPSLPQLAPLQQALLGAGGLLNCSAYFGKGTSAPAPSAAARHAATEVQSQIGTPDQSKPLTVGDLIHQILGGQP